MLSKLLQNSSFANTEHAHNRGKKYESPGFPELWVSKVPGILSFQNTRNLGFSIMV